MLLSPACEYGLSAMIYMAKNTVDSGPVRIRELADALDVPFPSLAKVVQKLTREGLLASQKGPGGGIALARPAGEVTLLEVVEAVEGRDLDTECILGISGCSERTLHCPLHDQWKPIRASFVKMLRRRSIENVAATMTGANFVLDTALGSTPGAADVTRDRRRSNQRRSVGK